MTATSAGSSSCQPAKGLDISLAALQRQDPYINNIVDVASQVALYTYNNRTNEWEKTEVEGTLFIYTRLASPLHGFTIMNRLSMENLTEPITKDLDFQLQHPFLLYRNARLVIHGIWFYDKGDCQRVAQKMNILTQQEKALVQSQGGWLSPGGGEGVAGGGRVGVAVAGGRGGGGGAARRSEAKGVDILQMLTKAHTEYDKGQSTSEPKEIGGSSVLCGNPNLIKPIPVKPNTQDSDGAEPKPLSLAVLFGSQHQHHRSPKSDTVSPLAESPAGKVTRPPVARTLTYEDAVNSSRSAASQGGIVAVPGCSDRGLGAVIGGHTVREDGGPAAAHQQQQQQQQQQNQPQHCPAIQKLMQGQRGVGGVVGVLQTVSESPENRLCDNGVPLEHHHHHHLLHHHQQLHHHHHQHQQQQQQLHPDPIQRLFQTYPLPPSSTSLTPAAPLCCTNPPPLQPSPQLPSQPIMVESVSCSHLQAQQNHQLFFNIPRPQPEVQHNSLSASAIQGTGRSSQMPGVVSPHELLQKLQLVQHEQSLASHDPPRLCPGLAPRFLGPTQAHDTGPVPNLTTAPAGALQFQVISPQRIPATVAPNLLLSPSMFTQVKVSSGSTAVSQESFPAPSTLSRPPQQEEIRVLSRSQLQAALLNLIQTDGSFLDTIYEAYVGRFANNSSSKY